MANKIVYYAMLIITYTNLNVLKFVLKVLWLVPIITNVFLANCLVRLVKILLLNVLIAALLVGPSYTILLAFLLVQVLHIMMKTLILVLHVNSLVLHVLSVEPIVLLVQPM